VHFEFDLAKSKANKVKHGIDFTEAQKLWDDEFSVEIRARSEVESRFAVIGMVERKCYSAFITYREETIRIISVRRARKKEIDIYESRRAGQVI